MNIETPVSTWPKPQPHPAELLALPLFQSQIPAVLGLGPASFPTEFILKLERKLIKPGRNLHN